jgi:putative hydrolase of the HAD superfamily
VSTIDAHFDVVVESCVERVRKPDAAFFRRACERLRMAPAECCFLDDIAANCRGAAAIGMRTIRVPIGGASGTEYRRALHELFALCPDAAALLSAEARAKL